MTVETELVPRLLFTAPWEPVVVRRGDALGLRALADQFADAIAPDLSNRVRDGRWVTILAWCLVRSHEVFHASGKRSVATRAEQFQRYAWLRPLELMWVARTIALVEDWSDRSLAGQRRVRPWYEYDLQSTDRFGMSEDQFRAYRQTGMYGGYRVMFRKLPEMTTHGDGWTPGKGTIQLADWLDGKLGNARPPWSLHSGDGDGGGFPRPDARSLGKEHQWWLRQWKSFDQRSKNADKFTLPSRRDSFAKLPEGDRLKPMVFGDDENGKRRMKVAQEVERATGSKHIDVCEHMAQVFAGNPAFEMLPSFSRLADAGMEAMDLIAEAIQNKSRVRLGDLLDFPQAVSICEALMAAAQAWRQRASMQLRHDETAQRLACAISSDKPIKCLESLLHYHESYGGGLRWFVLRNGWIEPRAPWRGGSSRYRFRLWSLCRLATQCGVLENMPRAIREDVGAEDEETLEAKNG